MYVRWKNRMKSLYYVTSIVWWHDRPIHLRWTRIYGNRKEPVFVVYEALTDLMPDPEHQGVIDQLLSHKEALYIADVLRTSGHEAIAIHKADLPLSNDELDSILQPGRNLSEYLVTGPKHSAYCAYTDDEI